jgi:hypothetical protein
VTRNYRIQEQRSLNFLGIEDVTLNKALATEFTDEQLEIYRNNMHLTRTEIVRLLNIDRLSYNFIIEKMKTRVNHRPDKPNPFAEKVVSLLKAGIKPQIIVDRLDVAMSMVSYYNKKLKKESEEANVTH